ncbi:nucleotidyltransferase [Thiospirochaeta perfilievii]|uniref:Nucleotidyltransferase n=1 Tax=Thiospirochaeta perfilievii TaxID=252967 RepID=A0A5C1QGF7_9SPIO|nr:nucleotidyltransferase domain-containing protein [Thiospirochaeta perfilievii]QEN05636.1 nucleotidyltransferase [Thiospirochaeta perfilievii]
MNEIDLLKQYYNEHKNEFGIKKIGFFGSFARGDYSNCSDIDIVVELSSPKMYNLVAIKQDLEDVYHRNIDIIRIREHMNPFLKKRIQAEAVYV